MTQAHYKALSGKVLLGSIKEKAPVLAMLDGKVSAAYARNHYAQ